MRKNLQKVFYVKYDGSKIDTYSESDEKLLREDILPKFIYQIIDNGKYVYPRLLILKNEFLGSYNYKVIMHEIFVQMHEILWEVFGINLSPYILFRDQVAEVFQGIIPVFHNRQITSFGGGGTSLLCYFANNYNNNSIKFPTERSHLPWKHMYSPLSKINYAIPNDFKVIYILNNPIDALLSIFRRNFQNLHPHNIMKNPQDFIKKIKLFSPDLAADFRLYTDIKWTFQDYINHQIDLWQITEHCMSWTQMHMERDYPILLIKYEAIWDNLDHIFKFLNLPINDIDKFPVKIERNTSYSKLAKDDLSKSLNIYGDLVDYINKFPSIVQV